MEPAQIMLTCDQCNQPVDEYAAFCGNCGVQLRPMIDNSLANTTYASTTYALPLAGGEVRAVLSVLCGMLAIPGILLPITGLALSVIGVIFGSLVLHSKKHRLALIGLIISLGALVGSLGMWAHNADQLAKERIAAASAPSQVVSSGAHVVSTPCYKMEIVGDFAINNDNTTCTLKANGTSESYAINSYADTTINETNYQTLAKQTVEGSAESLNATVLSETTSQFAGSPAFVATVIYNATKQETMVTVVVHPTASGQNIFVIEHAIHGGNADMGAIASKWEWK